MSPAAPPKPGSRPLEDTSSGDPVVDAERSARGSVTVAGRVVEKIAAVAISDVEQASGVPRRLLGQSLERLGSSNRPRVSATIDGSEVRLKLTVSVEYPAPVRVVAAQVRDAVRDQVNTFTGLTVGRIDITVPALVATRIRPARTR
jgi:uncharacterized alkaline shock family protein YloU